MMNARTFFVFIFLFLNLFYTNTISAEKINHPHAGISVWVPDNWKREQRKDILVVTDEKTGLLFAFIIRKKMSVAIALKVMNTELSGFVDHLRTNDKAHRMKVNGLHGVFIDGVGTIKGNPVQIGMALFYTPRDKVLMLLGIIQDGQVKANSKIVNKVLKSVLPM